MNLDMSNWGTFHIRDILSIMNGKSITTEEIEENAGDFVAVQSGEENNGCLGKIDLEYCKSMGYTYTEKSCLTVARTGSAGYVSFQINGCVVGDSAKILLLPDAVASPERYMFLQALLSANRYKYSYGRKVTEGKYMSDYIDLPIDKNGQPDWQFMEDYMKSLHHKPLTTGNANSSVPALNCENWRDFLLFDYFDILPGKYHYPDEYDEGITPYYSASNENNGIGQYIDLPPDFKGNCIVTGKIGCTAFYVPDDFCATSDVNIFKPKFDMSKYVGLFIATIMNFSENYKWAYGRQCRVGNSKKIIIKLPTDVNGNPDWQFMEDYIKSLPYGDRI